MVNKRVRRQPGIRLFGWSEEGYGRSGGAGLRGKCNGSLAKSTDRNVVTMKIFGPFRGDLVSLVEEAAVMTERLMETVRSS